MRRLMMSRFIRIYTVCHSVLIFNWDPYLEQWFHPHWKMEGSTPEESVKLLSGSMILWVYPFLGISVFTLRTKNVQYERGTAFSTRLHVRTAKIQISLCICVGLPESSLSAWRRFGYLATQREPCEDSDQTARMRKLILVFVGHTCSLFGKCCCPAHI